MHLRDPFLVDLPFLLKPGEVNLQSHFRFQRREGKDFVC